MALDDKTGKLHPLPERALDLALAGALLMELRLMGRIDRSENQLNVVSREDTGDALMNEMLQKLDRKDEPLTIQAAIGSVAHDSARIRSATFQSLIAKGILKEECSRFFFIFKERCYPVIDATQEKEVKARIRDVVLSNQQELSRKDASLICLMYACDLSHTVFTPEELEELRPRIKELSQQSVIGTELSRAISDIQDALLEVIAYSGI